MIWEALEYGEPFMIEVSQISALTKVGHQTIVINEQSGAEHRLWYDNWMPCSRDFDALAKLFKESTP